MDDDAQVDPVSAARTATRLKRAARIRATRWLVLTLVLAAIWLGAFAAGLKLLNSVFPGRPIAVHGGGTPGGTPSARSTSRVAATSPTPRGTATPA